MHDYPFEEDKSFDYDVLLAPADGNDLWTEPIHITNTASVDGTILVPPIVSKAARQLCTYRSATRHLWEWSSCYDHDDAFESAYYAGSYYLTVYGRAASIYMWVDGLSEIADTVRQWTSEASAALREHLAGQRAGTISQPFSRSLDGKSDKALQTLFAHPSLHSWKMWVGFMVADKRDLPVFLLGEYGLMDGREVKTAFELLEASLVAGPSRELLQAIVPIKAAKKQAIDVIFDISPTIPITTIQRRGNAKQAQHSVEESTVQLKRYLVGTEIITQGGCGFTYKIITPGHGRKMTMVDKINDWEVFQEMHRRPDSWSSSDSDMFPELQGRVPLSQTRFRSVTGTRQRWTEVTDTETIY